MRPAAVGLPAAASEVAIDQATAKREHLTVGEQIKPIRVVGLRPLGAATGGALRPKITCTMILRSQVER